MTEFHDFFINPELEEKATELGWSTDSIKASVKVLEAEDWGELKQKIQENREGYDILAFQGGSHELNRKAFSTPKMDVVLHPEKDRKDSGMNHVDAKKAAENLVATGFSLKQASEDPKKQTQVLQKWRRNLKLCSKYGAPTIITTQAGMKSELRAPRDLASIIDSLGFEGRDAASKHPEEILQKNLKAQEDSQIRPGHEVVK